MGYNTEFKGAIQIVPPLNLAELHYVEKFVKLRHVPCPKGPYFIHEIDRYALAPRSEPGEGKPGLYCSFVPDQDGRVLEWNEDSKTYGAIDRTALWIQYLIDHFLKSGAIASTSGDPQFADFQFNHVLHGELKAQGDDPDDMWLLKVVENRVTKREAVVSYEPSFKITIELTPEHKQMYDETIESILSPDSFSADCIGSWAENVCCATIGEENRWLLFEEGRGNASVASEGEAIRAFIDGQELPEGYHYFNRDTVEKVIAFGLLQHGIGFLDGTTDANDLDNAIQNVLLGEQTYC